MLRLCRVAPFLFCCLLCVAPRLRAQSAVPVVMLSDVHFDPFADPGKLPQLRAEPIEHWAALLSSPGTPTQAADAQRSQETCHVRATDTPWPLLRSALEAAHQAEARPAFVTLAGDLLTHEFPCRFVSLVPDATPQQIADFAAKTVAFVSLQTRDAFRGVPVYAALGNNDSACGDYRETPADSFVRSAARTLAGAAGVDAAHLSPLGDYSVALPAATVPHTRLLVLQDTVEAHQFRTCDGAADRSPESVQLGWLRQQLAFARSQHERVWVMAHMPPGIDVYSSFRRYVLQPGQLCHAEPQPFLADTALADTLLDYADVVRLALFGHTHMDEMRLLRREPVAEDASAAGLRAPADPAIPAPALPTAAIPVKIVPSISPILGNHPAFLVATVDGRTANLKDWRTVVSPGPQGSSAPWTEAYRFSATYHLPDLSAASMEQLATAFTHDGTGQGPLSSAFRQHFYPGDPGLYALGLAQIWPAYACSVRETRPAAVHGCLCAAVPGPESSPAEAPAP